MRRDFCNGGLACAVVWVSSTCWLLLSLSSSVTAGTSIFFLRRLFYFCPPPPAPFLLFFLLFYFQQFPRPSPAVRSPVMIGPELLKERPLANNRGLCSCVHVRPTRRWRRARGDAVKEIEKELKKGRQTLETGVHLHIMLRHRRDRISRDVLSPTDSSLVLRKTTGKSQAHP